MEAIRSVVHGSFTTVMKIDQTLCKLKGFHDISNALLTCIILIKINEPHHEKTGFLPM